MKLTAHLRGRLKGSGAGQTMVEFASVAFALFALIFGLMNLGTVVYYYNTISSAAREAVRYATIHSPTSANPATDDQIKQVAIDYAQGLDIEKNDVAVSFPTDTIDSRITKKTDALVTITYTYTLKIPFMATVSIPLTSSAQMLVSQ